MQSVDAFGLTEWNGELIVTKLGIRIPGTRGRVGAFPSLQLVLYSPCIDGYRQKLWLKGTNLESGGLANALYGLKTDVSFDDGGNSIVGQPFSLVVRGAVRNIVRLRIGSEESPIVNIETADWDIKAYGHFELDGHLTRAERPKTVECDEQCEQ